MRADLRLALLGDTELVNILSEYGEHDPVIASSAGADGDLTLAAPYLILRMGVRDPGVGNVHRRELVVWAHDRSGDYSRIDSILNRCRTALTALSPFRMADGNWITCVEWLQDSEDAYDDGPGTITRNSSYFVIGSGG